MREGVCIVCAFGKKCTVFYQDGLRPSQSERVYDLDDIQAGVWVWEGREGKLTLIYRTQPYIN